MPALGEMVSVGIITGAHGVRGEVKLRSFTADPAAIASYSPLETAAGRKIEIAKLRPRTDGFIATLRSVTDRTAAEALKGTELFIPRARLPEPGENQVYLRDLIGLAVWLKDGAKLGDVVATPNYGAGDLLDIKVEGRKDTVLIPITMDFVVETNVAAGKITVDLPVDYLDGEKP